MLGKKPHEEKSNNNPNKSDKGGNSFDKAKDTPLPPKEKTKRFDSLDWKPKK